MDPITMAIVAAAGAGMLKGVGAASERVVGDTYAALKKLLTQKFGAESDVIKAAEAVEARPDSAGRKTTLEEEVVAVKADQDPALRAAAQAVLDEIKAQPGGEAHIQQAIGSYIAQADRGGTASVRVNDPRQTRSPRR